MGGAAGEAYAKHSQIARHASRAHLGPGVDSKLSRCWNRQQGEGRIQSCGDHRCKEGDFCFKAADLEALASGVANTLALQGPNCLVSLDKPKHPIRLLYVKRLQRGRIDRGIRMTRAPTSIAFSYHWGTAPKVAPPKDRVALTGSENPSTRLALRSRPFFRLHQIYRSFL